MLKDYQIRFLDEYTQLYNKYTKLDYMIRLYDDNKLDFEFDCPVALLRRQRAIMEEYLNILEERAEYEGLKEELEKWL